MAIPKKIRGNIRQQVGKLLQGKEAGLFNRVRNRHFFSPHLFKPDPNGYISSGTFPVFQAVAGQNGQGFPAGVELTEGDTNWKLPGQLSQEQNLEVTEIGIQLSIVPNFRDDPELSEQVNHYQPTARVLNAFLQSTVVNVKYLTDTVPMGLASDFAQPAGAMMGGYQPEEGLPEGFDVPPDNTGMRRPGRYATNGFAAPSLRRNFKVPIMVSKGTTFQIVLDVPRTYWVGPVLDWQQGAIAPVPLNYLYAQVDLYCVESFFDRG